MLICFWWWCDAVVAVGVAAASCISHLSFVFSFPTIKKCSMHTQEFKSAVSIIVSFFLSLFSSAYFIFTVRRVHRPCRELAIVNTFWNLTIWLLSRRQAPFWMRKPRSNFLERGAIVISYPLGESFIYLGGISCCAFHFRIFVKRLLLGNISTIRLHWCCPRGS